MGYLIVRLSTQRDGKGPGPLLAKRAKLFEPAFFEVEKQARKLGVEIRSPVGEYDRALWPWTIVAYTSFRKDGVGRSGSSLLSFAAKPIPCEACIKHPGWDRSYGYLERKACRRCKGKGWAPPRNK